MQRAGQGAPRACCPSRAPRPFPARLLAVRHSPTLNWTMVTLGGTSTRRIVNSVMMPVRGQRASERGPRSRSAVGENARRCHRPYAQPPSRPRTKVAAAAAAVGGMQVGVLLGAGGDDPTLGVDLGPEEGAA
jgi:hypothetical protein